MNGLDLLETYSKASTVVTKWYLERMLDKLVDNSLPNDFKEMVRQRGIDNTVIGKLIDASPRGLFDVFDHYSIYVETMVDTEGGFWWKIGENQGSKHYEFRIDCDKAAIVEAFKLLNDKL